MRAQLERACNLVDCGQAEPPRARENKKIIAMTASKLHVPLTFQNDMFENMRGMKDWIAAARGVAKRRSRSDCETPLHVGEVSCEMSNDESVIKIMNNVN